MSAPSLPSVSAANSGSAAVCLGRAIAAREYVADVERFFELTRGHVVVMGHRTFTSVPDFAFKDRDILEIHASDRPDDVLARFPSRGVFIGGGPPVYAAYAPFIRHWDINRLP
jgi:dihydromethanopterin reductase